MLVFPKIQEVLSNKQSPATSAQTHKLQNPQIHSVPIQNLQQSHTYSIEDHNPARQDKYLFARNNIRISTFLTFTWRPYPLAGHFRKQLQIDPDPECSTCTSVVGISVGRISKQCCAPPEYIYKFKQSALDMEDDVDDVDDVRCALKCGFSQGAAISWNRTEYTGTTTLFRLSLLL